MKYVLWGAVFLLACGDDDGATDAAADTAVAEDAGGDTGGEDSGRDAARADAAFDAGPDPECGNGMCERGESAASCADDCAPCRPLPDGATDLEQQLAGLEADTWLEVPNTAMSEVCDDDSPVRGVVGCEAIVSAWSGGTFDTSRNRMLIWGGGHNDYHGNEVYAFDVPSGTWMQLTEPTATDHLDRDPLGDGNPVSRHTYEGVEYIAHADVMWGHGGSRAADGNGTDVTWTLDLSSLTWTNQAPAEPGPGGFTLASAYDPASEAVFVRGTQDFYRYDLDDNTWTNLMNFGFPPEWPRYERSGDKTGVIDPTRDLFWSMGSGDIFVWDIAASTIVTGDWVTTGGGDYTNADVVGDREEQLFESGGATIYDAQAPGVDYDAAADALVAWANRGGPWTLDLDARVWTQGSGEGAPISENSGGTFGRWRYISAYNVFILVNSAEENVRFYKHTRCDGR
ncbi:MAG: hypothetical protein AAGE52_16690 [Myxococcota bacterium]